jgi:polysaccharide export outer membrane protein
MIRRLAIVALLAAACGDPPPSKYPTQPYDIGDATLGPGDAFDMRIHPRAELGGAFSVGPEGTISVPPIGAVHVVGKTPTQVEKEVRDRLADGYLVNPTVTVVIKEYRSKKISVFGQVRTPGTLIFSEGMTIVEAISRAGGFTGMAKKNGVTVTRPDGDNKVTYTVPVERIGEGDYPNFPMRPGDVVFVPDRLW